MTNSSQTVQRLTNLINRIVLNEDSMRSQLKCRREFELISID